MKKKFILPIKRTTRPLHTKFSNGYAASEALLVFGLIIQLAGMMSITMAASGYVMMMNQQNEIDLAILSHVQAMIENNTWVKRCHVDEAKYIRSKNIEISTYSVHLTDHDTWIECTYQKKSQAIRMKVYYDETGITAMDIDSH